MTLAPVSSLIALIEQAWEGRAELSTKTQGEIRDAVDGVLEALDAGQIRVAEKTDGAWKVNEWVKKAVLLSFRLNDNKLMTNGPAGTTFWDKVPLKFEGWTAETYAAAGFRSVPGAFVRKGAFIAPGAVVLPCFMNLGVHVGKGTMIDAMAMVGSCAQIGENCHISSNVMIGGVLEPIQAAPVIIEDNCFIGAQCGVAEGMIVEEGAVLAMGTSLGASTKIIDRKTGEIFQGRVPAFSVVVPGTLPGSPLPNGAPGPNVACGVIVKRVDAKTRGRTSVNELLRDVS